MTSVETKREKNIPSKFGKAQTNTLSQFVLLSDLVHLGYGDMNMGYILVLLVETIADWLDRTGSKPV